MAEQIANFAFTVVSGGGYTAGSGLLNVASTSTGSGIQPFPGTGTFSVVISDQSTGAPKTLLEVTAINSAVQFAVTNNATTPDVNCNAGDVVYCVQDARSLTALLGGTDTAWAALSYSNGWADNGGGAQVGQYMRDRTGRVWLRGSLAPGTTTANTIIFTLPSGFRPLVAQSIYAVADNGTVVTSVLMRLNFATNGNVSIVYTFPTAVTLDLNGVSFSVN